MAKKATDSKPFSSTLHAVVHLDEETNDLDPKSLLTDIISIFEQDYIALPPGVSPDKIKEHCKQAPESTFAINLMDYLNDVEFPTSAVVKITITAERVGDISVLPVFEPKK